MIVRRAAAVVRPRAIAPVVIARRAASGQAHDDHHHHEEHDLTVYPKEDFSGGAWLYGIAFALGATAFYQLAPARGEEAYVTRFLNHYSTPRDLWESVNSKHLGLSADQLAARHFTQETDKPVMKRYQNPQMFYGVSPHLAPVGMYVDVSNLQVKS